MQKLRTSDASWVLKSRGTWSDGWLRQESLTHFQASCSLVRPAEMFDYTVASVVQVQRGKNLFRLENQLNVLQGPATTRVFGGRGELAGG